MKEDELKTHQRPQPEQVAKTNEKRSVCTQYNKTVVNMNIITAVAEMKSVWERK